MPREPVTVVTHAGGARAAATGRLAIVEGPDAPREIAIPKAGAIVGLSPECTLQLTDKRVSRNHVHVTPEPGGYRVRDLGSTNGTFVDGTRIDDGVVPAGTAISLGKTVVRVLAADEVTLVPPSTQERFGRLLGRSLAMREVFGVLERVVDSDASILVEGETGTGKEEVAQAVHAESRRRAGPFVVIDCGAIAESLVDSELFGHQKGAFTGATETRLGAFERADGGTLFLDELGELPLALQPKLLRVLEAREVRKLGAGEARKIDVRVIAGTHRDLEEMVAEGTFREDLFYRLAVVRVRLPPLRQRVEDLPLLVDKFLRDAGVDAPGPIDGPGLAALAGHAWPGNARELRNVIARAVACAGRPLPFRELSIHVGGRARAARGEVAPSAVDVTRPFGEAKTDVIDAFERRYLAAMLEATEGNIAEAARRSGLNRRHLYDLLKKHGLRA